MDIDILESFFKYGLGLVALREVWKLRKEITAGFEKVTDALDRQEDRIDNHETRITLMEARVGDDRQVYLVVQADEDEENEGGSN